MSDTPHDTLAHGGLQERRDVLLTTTREALAAADVATLRLVLNSQHAVDLADLLRRLDGDDRRRCMALLAESLAAGVLAEFDATTVVSVAEELDDQALSGILEEMAPDDAADVLADLPDEHSERVLSLMEVEEADEVRELMEHPEDSGGGIMTSRLVAVTDNVTVAGAIDHLRTRAGDHAEEPLAVFVVDDRDRLVGSVSLHSMLLADREAQLSSVADHEPITVRADMDQEEIAEIFADYDLLALPVVDAAGILVGQVTVDDIVDVIQEEATEDNLKMAATSSAEMEDRSVIGVMRRRLPWLLFCLLGTLLSGGVLDLFSGVLAALSPLVLFVPAIMAMGGNSGIQTSTVTVRSLATGILQPEEVRRALWREFRVAALMGTFLGLVVFVVAWLWTGGSPVAPCAGVAMFAAVVLSAVLGATIPILFRTFGIDPAVASGPLITTVNDILSLCIYFGVATALLQLLTG
ncbi:MAG: magnesium transporter [Candidatus Latescibacteria bacterium]|jgi:magnesium transporter|nr:magnesium transporter [Gemmatimonadaceae bacterium]MDP7450365.1 magnesium transporter [Candidatus Latescibacterota bacterium]HJP32295.1 magnesium transporter [Candidatus Latescibacterota bacterium]